ncbi:MAG: hypothetical protein HY762_01430 [Planctomycetes bacterium]|nr:hypothetical protein [Planctomycetota bacterium]
MEDKADETFATADTPEIQARIKKVLANKKTAEGIEEFRKELVSQADIQILK